VTGVELILTALSVGVAGGSSEAAKAAVLDAYTGLKDVLRRRLVGRDEAVRILEANPANSAVQQRQLGKDLVDIGADRDKEVLMAARQILALVDSAGVADGKYNLPQHGASGNTVQIGTNYGPAAGTMTGPVKVSYGDVPPVPPAAPGA